MSWVAIAVGVGTAVVGGVAQNNAADKAADAAQQGSSAEIAERRRQFDLSRQDYKPFMDAGVGALGRQEAFLGGDMSGFENSPDYKYAYDQMIKSNDSSAAAGGRLFSGGYGLELAQNVGGLASQNANSYWSKLAGQAGQGFNATSGLAGLGAGMANANANSIGNAANARGSMYQQQGANNAGMWGAIGGGLNQGYQQNSARNGGGSGWYFGNNPGQG